MQGGGGSRSTGKSRALDTDVILNSERSERDSGSDQCDRKNELSSGGANERERRGDPVSQCCVLKWIATRSATARNDAGGRAGLLFGWSLKSHVQPLWMALSAFTMAVRLSRSTESRALIGLLAHGRRIAFTMAEILLSLTIIGVVAAITLPSLTGNINERTWNTQRKALYARFSQAIALMPALNGYGTLTEGDSSASAVDTAAETFVTAGLSKVLKINNICDSEHLADCGVPEKFNPYSGSAFSVPKTMGELNPRLISTSHGHGISLLDTKAAAFETQNGESIIVYYNPRCIYEFDTGQLYFFQTRMCANFIYDLNGNKGPNTFGKDIGYMTAFFASDPLLVAPNGYLNRGEQMPFKTASGASATNYCTNLDAEYRLPSLYELASVVTNIALIGDAAHGDMYEYWSSTIKDSDNAWSISVSNGGTFYNLNTDTRSVLCIKR